MGDMSTTIEVHSCPAPKAGLIFRAMNVQELGEEYRNRTDKELLRLALTPEQLTPEAKGALTAELATRGINGEASLDAARREEEQRKAENDRELGAFGFVVPIGVGRMRFGKANRVYDPETDIERFKTTIFIVLLCFPLIPTGTYLVERKRVLPDKLTGIEKLSLDWEQVLRVWVVAAGSILGFIWLIKIVSSDAAWRLVHR
jgi:hypothetical protein